MGGRWSCARIVGLGAIACLAATLWLLAADNRPAQAQSAQQPRLALIIANQDYTDAVGPLANPHNDARLIEAALGRHGFDVDVRLDLSEDDMELAVEDFAERVAAAGANAVSLFYYAGHGASRRDGVNFLIPVSVRTLDDRRLWAGSVRLDAVRRTLRNIAPDAQHIVVFDACRNELSLPPEDRGRRGFEVPTALGGMLTAFAASPGEFASDGRGRANGPYAEAFATALDRARGDLAVSIFERTRIAVRQSSPTQTPLISGGLDRLVIFDAGFEVTPPPHVVTPPTAPRIETTASSLDGATVFLTGDTAQLEPLSVFRECDVCPEMVALPGGTFTMGSPETEAGRDDDEGPQQRVTIQPFAMGRTEVTFAMWDACAADGFCRPVDNDRGWGRDQRPVISVSWNDITGEDVSERGFLAWLNSRPGVSGAPYRLPSEAEWAYAARGGAQSAYSFGETVAQLRQHGWYTANSGDGTEPVGRLRPNPFGLYDVHGNVWEWVQDCWNDSLSASLRDGGAQLSGDCSNAVLRGGSWLNAHPNLRSAERHRSRRVDRLFHFGLRVARAP